MNDTRSSLQISVLCRFIGLIIGLTAISAPGQAQTYTMGEESWITWEDFLESYTTQLSDSEDDDISSTQKEETIRWLEELKETPINLNTTNRATLLELPFLMPEQVDSILLYRQKRHLFRSMGELQFIKGLSYDTRRFLSLFVYAGDTIETKATIAHQLFHGKHKLLTQFDIPLYRRAGQQDLTKEELREHPNKYYLGNGLANVVRYRYNQGQDVAYGITLEKDAGEPFAANGNYPYDYTSGYFYMRSRSGKYSVLVGDYNVAWAQGLAMGGNFFSGKLQIVENVWRMGKEIRPHTSSNEYNYLRGVATTMRFSNQWSLSAFASYRKLDANTNNGVVTSLKTDGLHRTLTELDKRNTLGNATSGIRIAYDKQKWHIALHALYTYYTKKIAPPERIYNRYYLRGNQAAVTSIDYSWKSKKWMIIGETAIDKNGHPSTTNSLKYRHSDRINFTLQQRSLSPRFISPFGNTLQAGSRTCNEHGILFGMYLRPHNRLTLTAYTDLYIMPKPTYNAYQTSKGMEAYLQAKIQTGAAHTWTFRYRFKTYQQNISGHNQWLEYNSNHNARIASAYTSTRWNINIAVDARILTKQTTTPQLGWMLSARSTQKWHKKFTSSLFAAAFFTDSYATRLYAYEPQLQHAAGFPTFAYHGMRFVAVGKWEPTEYISFGLRYGLIHYFNREEISSGGQLIQDSSKNDISLQVYFKL